MPSERQEQRWTIYVCAKNVCGIESSPGPCGCREEARPGFVRFAGRIRAEVVPASVADELRRKDRFAYLCEEVERAERERDELREERDRLRAQIEHSICATCGKRDAHYCSSAYHRSPERGE